MRLFCVNKKQLLTQNGSEDPTPSSETDKKVHKLATSRIQKLGRVFLHILSAPFQLTKKIIVALSFPLIALYTFLKSKKSQNIEKKVESPSSFAEDKKPLAIENVDLAQPQDLAKEEHLDETEGKDSLPTVSSLDGAIEAPEEIEDTSVTDLMQQSSISSTFSEEEIEQQTDEPEVPLSAALEVAIEESAEEDDLFFDCEEQQSSSTLVEEQIPTIHRPIAEEDFDEQRALEILRQMAQREQKANGSTVIPRASVLIPLFKGALLGLCRLVGKIPVRKMASITLSIVDAAIRLAPTRPANPPQEDVASSRNPIQEHQENPIRVPQAREPIEVIEISDDEEVPHIEVDDVPNPIDEAEIPVAPVAPKPRKPYKKIREAEVRDILSQAERLVAGLPAKRTRRAPQRYTP